jgi:hypothetical protein
MKLYKKGDHWFFQIGKTTTRSKSFKWCVIHALNLTKLFTRSAMLGYVIGLIDLGIILTWQS